MQTNKLRKLITITVFAFFVSFIPDMLEAAEGINILQGIGSAKSRDEAKSLALQDLSASINARVYSKYTFSDYSSSSLTVKDSSRFIKIISDVPILTPKISYFNENGSITAVAVLENGESYIKYLNSLVPKINEMLKNAEKTEDKALYFSLLEKILPLYEDFQRHATVLDILGEENYPQPYLSHQDIFEKYISMTLMPPDLNIASEIITKNMKDKHNIFVPPAVTASGQTTEFGIFFSELLSSKINSAIEERASYKLKCVYAETDGSLLTSCSLFSGGSAVVSSAVKIPIKLVSTINYKDKGQTVADGAAFAKNKGKLHASVKISPEKGSSILRKGDYFTLMVRLNKPAFVYGAAFSSDNNGFSGIFAQANKQEFLYRAGERGENVWSSIGRYRAGDPLDVSSIYIFAISQSPADIKNLLPEYLREELYNKEKPGGQIAADLIEIFNGLEGEKFLTIITPNFIGK